MTELYQVLSDCYAMDIRFNFLDGDGLNVDAPFGLLTPERLDRLKTHKDDLLAYLRKEAQCHDGQEHEWEDTPERDGKTRRFCQRCCKFGGFVQPDESVVPAEPIPSRSFGSACDRQSLDRADHGDEEVALKPCVGCGSLELWESLKSRSLRCMRCDPPMKTFEELKAQAVELQ